nr:MAG TPA: hypothetical protein [Caudoviricetes sp.]
MYARFIYSGLIIPVIAKAFYTGLYSHSFNIKHLYINTYYVFKY